MKAIEVRRRSITKAEDEQLAKLLAEYHATDAEDGAKLLEIRQKCEAIRPDFDAEKYIWAMEFAKKLPSLAKGLPKAEKQLAKAEEAVKQAEEELDRMTRELKQRVIDTQDAAHDAKHDLEEAQKAKLNLSALSGEYQPDAYSEMRKEVFRAWARQQRIVK